MVGRELLGVAHRRRTDDRAALGDPVGKDAQICAVVAEGLVDEERDARFDERPCPVHMFEPLVGRDQNGIDLADHVLGPGGDVRDLGDLRDLHRVGGIVRPDMGDLCARDTERFRWLLGNVVLNDGVGALGQGGRVIGPVDDDAPGIGMPIALDHAQHGQRKVSVAKWKSGHRAALTMPSNPHRCRAPVR